MSQPNYSILQYDLTWAQAASIEIMEAETEFLLHLNGFVLNNLFDLELGQPIDLQLNLRTKPMQSISFTLLEIINSENSDSIALRVEGGWQMEYFDPMSWEILLDWDYEIGRFKNWTELDEEGQAAWLLACLHWSGIASQLEAKRELEIDGTKFITKEGFYCHLGEVFIGFRGYFGQDLDGLEDCIRSLANRRFNPEENKIKILHITQIQQTLDSESDEENYGRPYSEIVWDIFRENGFELVF